MRREPLYLILLLALGIAAWGSSFYGAFVFDDYHAIVDNKRLPELSQVVQDMSRPLERVSLWLNYQVSGREIWSYHLFNVILHLTAAAMLMAVVRRTVRYSPLLAAWRDSADGIAFWGAALWLVHPLQTEAVTYVIQRTETMTAFFNFAMLYAFARLGESGHAHAGEQATDDAGNGAGGARIVWQLTALAAFALGLLSKQGMLAAPAAAFCYSRIFWSASLRDTLRRGWLVWGVFLIGFLAALTQSGRIISLIESGTRHAQATPWTYLLTQCGVITEYLRLAIWPHPLCLDHIWPLAMGVADVWPQAVFLATLAGVTLWALWKRPALGFLGAWFFIQLAMRSSIIPRAIVLSEHRMVLPLAAVTVLVAAAGVWLWQRMQTKQNRILLVVAGVVILAALSVRTGLRSYDYRDPIILWKQVLALYPQNPRALYTLGQDFKARGEYAEAEAYFRKSIQNISARKEEAVIQLGSTLALQGKYNEAIEEYRKALNLDATRGDVWAYLGKARELTGDPEEALRNYTLALERAPDNDLANFAFGQYRQKQGHPADARRHYERALRTTPDFPLCQLTLGKLLLAQGEPEAAMNHFIELIERQQAWLDKGYEKSRDWIVQAAFQMGLAFGQKGDHQNAGGWFLRAATMNPDDAEAWFCLGAASIQLQKYGIARQALEQAAALRPGHADTHYNLGLSLERLGDNDGARRELETYNRLTAAGAATSP